MADNRTRHVRGIGDAEWKGMKKEPTHRGKRRRRIRGSSFVDVLIIVATVFLMGAVVLPRFARTKCGAPRISCVNNLKQVGLSFRIYANDNNDRYPMAVPESEGGAEEAVARGDVFRIFQVMSNELSVPKTILCPADWKNRSAATNWTQLSNSNISYLVGLDAADTRPDMILSGDRDIAEGGQLLTGLVNLTTNRPVAWHRLLHQEGGNIGLADGSVQQFNDSLLRRHLAETGDTTNRVLFPQ